MKRKPITGAIVLWLYLVPGSPGTAWAQAPGAESYTFATYYQCDGTQLDRVDEIFARSHKPAYDAAVADGTIATYGWLVNHAGGEWRRALYYMAPSVAGLLEAREKIAGLIAAKEGEAGQAPGGICAPEADYTWRMVLSNEGTLSDGGRISLFSVYHVCDLNRETQADALMAQVYAPIYDGLVADRTLKSWHWLERTVGGEYRRASVMSATDFQDLMAAQARVTEALETNPLSKAFSDICGSRTDYMWEIKFPAR